jgi:hypothetical protein
MEELRATLGFWCPMAITIDVALSGGALLYAKTKKREMPSLLKDLVRLQPGTVLLWEGSRWLRVKSWEQVAPPSNRRVISQQRRSGRHRNKEVVFPATFDIHLRSGERIGCLGDTTFRTLRGPTRASKLVRGDILLTTALPEPELPNLPECLPDELVGWFIGLYLAEGSRSADTIQIASNTLETERFHRLGEVAAAFHGFLAVHSTGGKSATANLNGPALNGVLDTYISGKRARGKHLSVRCWERSNAFLRAVLQSYLEADGHYDEDNDRWRVGFTLNNQWAADLRVLCARLGISVRLQHATHTMNDKQFRGYRGQVRFQVRGHHNAKSDAEVVRIEQNRARRYWKVNFADGPARFALGSGVCCLPSDSEL